MSITKSYGGTKIPAATAGIDIMFEREAGIYRIDVGHIAHYGSTWDLSRAKRENLEKLVHGEHEHHWLQKEFFQVGLGSTSFEIIEKVEWPRSTVYKKQKWQETNARKGRRYTVRSSSGTVPERVPGFNFQRFERLLGKHLEYHHVAYLQDELKKVLTVYRRKVARPKWLRWCVAVKSQIEIERMAAAMQISRVYRGHAARCKLYRRRRREAVPTIQRYYRGHMGRKRIEKRRLAVARLHGATVIQNVWRKHIAKNITNVLRAHKRLSRAATNIERVFRGFKGRKLAYSIRLEKAVLRVQTSWRAHHGKLSYQMKKRALAVKRGWENEGAIAFQRIFRGYMARKLRAHLEFVRLEHAVLRIQCSWRRKQGQYTYHLLQKAKKEREAHDRQVREEKEAYDALLSQMAIRIQCAWRRKKGSMSYHLKMQARKHDMEEQKLRDDAAHRIQMWWHNAQGNFAARLNARAKLASRRHKRERKRAAMKIQAWYRGCTGRLAYHLKQQAKAHMEEEYHAASKIQMWWHHLNGNFAAQLKARAEVQMRRIALEEKLEAQKLERAVIRVQSLWRKKKGQFAYHLKMLARREQKEYEIRLERAAIRVQGAWRKKTGEWARHMKMRARAADIEHKTYLNSMALRIQSAWRRKQGNLAYHIKMQARKADEEHRRHLDRAAHRIQMWWHHTQGNFAARFKARAEVEQRRHERELDDAAHRIQMWWHHTQGNFAARFKARAEVERRRHEQELDAAAHRIQMWWHHTQGNFAARLNARAKVEQRRHERELDEAAHRIQMWWHHMQGSLAKRIRMRAEKAMQEEHEREERAALKIQARWRARKGQLAYHMKRKAIRELSKHVHDWVEFFDDWSCIPYWHSNEINMTVFEKPDNYNADLSKFYEEYDYKNSMWGFENLTTKEMVYILPKGAILIEKPKPPKPPRTYINYNGYWRHKRRKPLDAHNKWTHKRDTLKKLVFGIYNYDETDQRDRIAPIAKAPKKKIKNGKLRILPPIPRGKPPVIAEKIDKTVKKFQRVVVKEDGEETPEEEQKETVAKTLETKRDLHDFLVRKYAKRSELHIRKKGDKVKKTLLKKVKILERVKMTLWIGGTDAKNHLRYFPGEVSEVHLDGTYNIFLDDGTIKQNVRRDEFVFEFEEELPTPRSDASDDEDANDNLNSLMIRKPGMSSNNATEN